MLFLADLKNENENVQNYQEHLNKDNWSSEEIKETIDQIDAKLIALGFERVSGGRYNTRGYAKRSYDKSKYIGTFYNSFSKRDEVPLWSDHYISAYKYLTVSEVYRHNGTNTNASIRISVISTPKYQAPEYYKDKEGNDWVSTGCILNSERISKFKPSVSEKVLTKRVEEAVAKIESIVLEDYSQYEKNRADYHEDTTKAHWKWVQEQKFKEAQN